METKTMTRKEKAVQYDKVEYRYIPRKPKGLEGDVRSHVLKKGRLVTASDGFTVLRNEFGGYTIDLSEDELSLITRQLGLDPEDLNLHRRNNPYLSGINIKLTMDKTHYDLNDPYQRLLDGILRAYNNVIANGIDKQELKVSYVYVRVVEGSDVQLRLDTFQIKKKVYKELEKLENNRFKMLLYLTLIGTRINPDITDDALVGVVNLEVEKNFNRFLETLEIEDFNYKGSLRLGVQLGIIDYKASMYYYSDAKLAEENDVANLDNSVEFLKSKANADIWLAITKDINDAITGTK